MITVEQLDTALKLYLQGLDCPEWLYALRHVKVRHDEFAGVPLLDFLGELHARHMPVGQAFQHS